MRAIIIREVKDRRFSLLAYCAIVLMLLLLYIGLFPSIKASMDQFQKLYETYPKGFYNALGIENININTIENYLAIEMYSIMWPILALLLSASLAGNAIAGQIERGVMGFYLALPIHRIRLFFAKYAAGLIGVAIFILISVIGVLPLTAVFGSPVSATAMLKLSLLSLLFMWAVFAAAMFLSALFNERSKVYMFVGGGLVVMYAANVVAGLKQSLSWLGDYSIFHYYNAQNVLSHPGLPRSSIIVFTAAIVLFTAAGAIAFQRKDVAV